jgi:hypothetical protein
MIYGAAGVGALGITPCTAPPRERRDPAWDAEGGWSDSAPMEPASEHAIWVPAFAGMSGCDFNKPLNSINSY